MDGEPHTNKIENLHVRDAHINLVLQDGEQGIVIGAGSNSDLWKRKGFTTLDNNNVHNPTFVGDANYLRDLLGIESYNLVVSEYLTFSAGPGDEGVSMTNIAHGCFEILKPGGKLIIIAAETMLAIADVSDAAMPLQREMIASLEAEGFVDIESSIRPTHQIVLGEKPVGDKVLFEEVYLERSAICTARKPNATEIRAV